jgi:hypothetical protein
MISIVSKWGENASRTDIPLKSFKISNLRPVSSKIINGINFGFGDIELWPDVLESFKKLGFNTFYAFGNVSVIRTNQLELINKARNVGFTIAYSDSPFFRLYSSRWKKSKEVFCQLPQNKYSNSLCPSYKGKFYNEEIDRIAENCRLCQPSAIFFDTELWGSGGPARHGATKCTRCQKAKLENKFKTWDDLFGISEIASRKKPVTINSRWGHTRWGPCSRKVFTSIRGASAGFIPKYCNLHSPVIIPLSWGIIWES